MQAPHVGADAARQAAYKIAPAGHKNGCGGDLQLSYKLSDLTVVQRFIEAACSASSGLNVVPSNGNTLGR